MKYTRNNFKNQKKQSKKSFYVAACAALACVAVVGTVYYKTEQSGKGSVNLADNAEIQPAVTAVGDSAISSNWVADADGIEDKESQQASSVMNADSGKKKEQAEKKKKPDVEVKANKEKNESQQDKKAESQATMSNQSKRTFNEEKGLTWPVKGDVLMKFSQNNTIYFKTLAQYKSNPAIEISADEGTKVIASAAGVVTDISKDDVTGTMVTTDIGGNYTVTYGQLKNVKVSKGDEIKEGQLLGTVASPTKYFSEEGSNLYFQVKENGTAVDPLLLLN